jgi:hypothetical protein
MYVEVVYYACLSVCICECPSLYSCVEYGVCLKGYVLIYRMCCVCVCVSNVCAHVRECTCARIL